jgi:peptidoglycan hydrolase-like protein with peptidoglycan-binding domain
MARYPVGYGTASVSFDELKRRYSGGMEPEYARRLFAWIESKNGAVGIGSAWRPNASTVSQASRNGKSFHQTQTFADGTKHFCAVDLVVPTNGKHTSGGVPVDIVPIQGSREARRWGVHVNIGTPGKPGFESWHMQPIEIDGWGTWADAGRNRPVPGYDLPVDVPAVTPPPSIDASVSPFAPEFSEYGLYPLDVGKIVVHRESQPRPHDLVRYLQGVLRNQCRLTTVEIDGYFGDDTKAAVKAIQRWNRLTEHGRCDSATWACIDAYASV